MYLKPHLRQLQLTHSNHTPAATRPACNPYERAPSDNINKAAEDQ